MWPAFCSIDLSWQALLQQLSCGLFLWPVACAKLGKPRVLIDKDFHACRVQPSRSLRSGFSSFMSPGCLACWCLMPCCMLQTPDTLKACPTPFDAGVQEFEPDKTLPVSVLRTDPKSMKVCDVKNMSWEQHIVIWKVSHHSFFLNRTSCMHHNVLADLLFQHRVLAGWHFQHQRCQCLALTLLPSDLSVLQVSMSFQYACMQHIVICLTSHQT